MKIPLHPLALVGACVVLATACHKKEEVPAAVVAQEAESKLPPQEQAPAAAPQTAEAAPVVGTASATVNSSEKDAYEAWFKKYHLDLNDPKMLDADPDGDGFTNREEFLANTNPLDPTSHPPVADPGKILKLKEYSEARLPVTLENIEGDKAKLRRSDGDKMETVRVGDTVRGLPLKVLKIEERRDIDKNGEKVDLSQVTLEDASTKEKYVLTGNLPAKTSASYAVLVTNDGKASLKVRHGDVFTYPTENGTNYKVIDMSQDQVVLQQMDNKKMWTVPRQTSDPNTSVTSEPAK